MLRASPGESPCLERKSESEEERKRGHYVPAAWDYSQRIRHLSSLESMIYFSTSQKGYVCHRTLKGLLEIAAEAKKKKKKKERQECRLLFECQLYVKEFYGFLVWNLS